ncbi:MAG TPA: class I SAM-dependent methyltransferase [Dongiaceae bacterium]|nr:class I SAM-dependent methyltransferase [Dongiaceae bacterium]
MTRRSYILRGGIQGRERLRVLARIMRPGTLAALARVGVPAGRILDLGCGGGDVTIDLARLAGDGAAVTGLDFDPTVVELACDNARAAGFPHVAFRVGDLHAPGIFEAAGAPFDLIYSRFLISHLPDPDRAISLICRALRPGGLLLVEDVDFTGYFCFPASPAFDRYVDLYRKAAHKGGADPDIGPSLPSRLMAAGLEDVGIAVSQPAGLTGDTKLITALTMEGIAERVIALGLATAGEVSALVDELHRLARDRTTVMATPRVVQAWGRRAGSSVE